MYERYESPRLGPFVGAIAAGATTSPARAQTNQTTRVGSQPTEPGMEPYFARIVFFAAAGLDVDVQTISSPSAVIAAVTSGTLDIG